MNKVQNKKLIPLAAILLSVILAITTLWSLAFFNTTAFAAENTEYVPFPNTAVKIENNQFGSSSGNVPKNPDNWTGGGVSGMGAGGTKGGVIDLNEYAKYKEEIKLNKDYPADFVSSPQTPFGTSDYPETNTNVLMINTRPSGNTAFGYTSAPLTFDAGKFYSISAWVRTGDFLDDTGAAIRLTGLGESVAFNNINTVKKYKGSNGKFDPTLLKTENNYGWQQFSFYIAAPSSGSKTVSVSLQVGDAYADEANTSANFQSPASGYAFFDNIEAYEVSPLTFYEKKATSTTDGRVLVKDFSDLSNYLDSNATAKYEDENWNFAKGLQDWSRVSEGATDPADLTLGVYDSSVDFNDKQDNNYNLKKDPVSSLGKFKPDSKILVLSSFDTAKDYHSIAAGVRSKDIKIERYKFYRISAWVKTIDISGGNGATMVLHAERGVNKTSNLNAKIANCVGDEANKSREGYKQYSFFVKGSCLKDYNVNLDLMLGTAGSESKGIALFDNATIENITPKQFTDNSASGTVVNLDTDNGVDGNPYITFADTGIANGRFYFAGDYTDYKFPMPVADWTKYDVETVGTTGYSTSTDFINSDNIISGIVPTDKEHFEANKKNYGENIYNPRVGSGSMLLMSSKSQTAFCYRSPSFSVTAKKAEDTDVKIGKLTVDMFVDNVSGYGASLVLKSGTNVISTIENIQNTNSSKAATYTFYVEAGKVDVSDLSVEIWLGLNDRSNNTTKLSSGNIYVEKVAFAMVTDSFAEKQAAYNSARHSNMKVHAATYSFANEDFGAYDYYDTSFVKHPYNYTLNVKGDASNVVYGIFDPMNGLGNQDIVPHSFKNSEDAKSNGVLMLKNSAPAASSLSLNSKYSLEADKYYKISVRLKVDIANTDGAGAGIKLTGSDFKFENIKLTAETPDQITNKEVFQTFTFYIKCGATATSVGIDITLGEGSSTNNFSSGIVYVNDINFTDITNTLYDENTTDAKLKDNKYVVKAVLSESAETTPEETPKQPIQWWLIPSILFAIAILIAIVGFSVRKIIEKRKQNKPINLSSKSASYDRENTLNRDFNDKTPNTADKLTTSTPDDKTYDKFSDDSHTQKTIVEVQKSEITEVTPETTSNTPPQTSETTSDTTPQTPETTSTTTTQATTSTTTPQTPTTPPQTPTTTPDATTPATSFTDQFDD